MENDTGKTRVCSICGTAKPADTTHFHFANSKTGQLRPMCKPCRSSKPVQQQRERETLDALKAVVCPSGCRLIPLRGERGKGKASIVEEGDYERVAQHRWFLMVNGYAVTTLSTSSGKRTVLLHRMILDEPDSVIDHANRDKLDNRRSNLRLATLSQNAANAKARSNSTSGFKGVYWSRRERRWKAEITVNGKKRSLGYFIIAEDAAQAYDGAARQHFGEFAHINSQ